MTQPFCPHCGYDLHLDAPILLNDFSMLGPMAPLQWRGESIKMTGFERNMCWALMKAYPNPVRIDVLLDRMGSEGFRTSINVFVHRARKKILAAGAPNPIQPASARGQRGYVWVLT